MKRTLILVAAVLMIPTVSGTLYQVSLDYSDGDVSVTGLDMIEGEAETNDEGDYVARLLSFQGEELASTSFDFHTEVSRAYTPNRNFTTDLDVEQTSRIIHLPYHEKGSEIVVLNATGGEEASVNVSEYAVCNQNLVCEEGENKQNCPYDCAGDSDDDGSEEKGIIAKIVDFFAGIIDWLVFW